MASIADVFFSAYLEDKGLQLDAVKAGDKAGQTLGQRMSGGIGTAMRAGLGVVGAAAGFATKGILELENVTADFRAETGATADEARAAGEAINEMAGRNLQPMAEIGDALAKVHTDLGQTGEAAEATAENFLHFARVTGQDAASEVAAFDDILDAWGLTAEDSQEIMDKLIVSHQEYGGSISENEAALAGMAPALKALNADVDDGIGLLNLFAASGLDASAAQAALKKAVAELEPGQGLDDLISEISSIEDPTLRAQRAMEIFGARGGAGLANALQPGIDSLDDFQISTEEATGATEEARDALDNTFSNRVQLAIKGITSQMIEFGSSFGPVLTGLASLTSLGGALGFGKLGGKLGGAISAFFQDISLGKRTGLAGAINRAGTFVGRTFSLAVTTATKIADAIVGLFNRLLGSNAVKGAAAKAGGAIAAVFSGALVIANKLGSALSSALNALPGVSAVQSAALASGGKVGTTMGKAAGLAFKAGFVVGLAAIADDINNAIQDATKDVDLLGSVGIETDFNPEAVGWPLGPAQSEWSDWFFNQLPESMRQGAKDAFGIIPREASTAMADLENFPGKLTDDLATGLSDGAPEVEEGAEIMFDGLAEAALQAVADARQAGRDAVGAYASALRGGWDSVFSAWDSLKDAMKDPLSRAKRIAQLEGILASKRLAKGLRSNDPLIRADAEALVVTIEDELALLKEGAEDRGKKGGKGFADGLVKTRDDAKAAARLVANAAAGVLEGLNLRDEGADAGGEFAKGLQSTINTVARVASALASVVAQYLEFGSPTELGPFSKKGGPAGWARIGADDWVQGWNVDPSSTLRRLAESARNALAAPLAGAALPIAASVGATGVGGGIGGLTINGGIHVSVSGGSNPAETGAAVRQGIADSMADILRSQTARLPTGTRA